MASPNVIVFDSVCKSYGEADALIHVLTNVNLEIVRGEFLAVVGDSGSGKSTFLNVLAGMDRFTSGRLFVNGLDLAQLSEAELTKMRRDHIAFIFQFYNLIPTLTAIENVIVASELSKDPLDPSDIMSEVGLSAVQHHFPSELSGGQQQRVAIARALVMNAPILLCDEPTGALGTQASDDIMALIHRIHQQHNKTVIFVTHNQQVAQYSDRLMRIVDGEIELIDRSCLL